MKHCTGPCDQGRRSCPCPLACEAEDPAGQKDAFELLGMAFLAVVLAAVIVVLLTILL